MGDIGTQHDDFPSFRRPCSLWDLLTQEVIVPFLGDTIHIPVIVAAKDGPIGPWFFFPARKMSQSEAKLPGVSCDKAEIINHPNDSRDG